MPGNFLGFPPPLFFFKYTQIRSSFSLQHSFYPVSFYSPPFSTAFKEKIIKRGFTLLLTLQKVKKKSSFWTLATLWVQYRIGLPFPFTSPEIMPLTQNITETFLYLVILLFFSISVNEHFRDAQWKVVFFTLVRHEEIMLWSFVSQVSPIFSQVSASALLHNNSCWLQSPM